MGKRNRNHIEGAMANHGMVFFLIAVLTIFGFWSLPKLNKDEFPQFTIRLGVVAAIYPGATAEEIEEQVTEPLEKYLFTFQEIDKEKTHSTTKDGIVYIYTELREDIEHKDEIWAKIRAGLNLFKLTSLPKGVLQVVVVDDFGSTSSLLMTVESNQRSPRELEDYAKLLSDRLRAIPEMGKVNIIGTRQEEISVDIDIDQLSKYGINQSSLLMMLSMQGLRSLSGTLPSNGVCVHVDIPFKTEQEIKDQIVMMEPLTGHALRLSDVAEVQRHYVEPTKYIKYFEGDSVNGVSCLVIELQMAGNNNIVEFGEKVDDVITETMAILPPDVKFHTISNQPKVVDDSVTSFLGDILMSIVVVVLVMLVLFPIKTSIVASTGVPICIAVTLALMYLFNVQLNTVTLAALIVVLGMIVDNSIIVVDGYTNELDSGHSPWYSASVSTKALFMPMIVATCSISAMFFPMPIIFSGIMKDFVKLFPWTVFFAMTASIGYAVWVTPYLATRLIHKQKKQNFIDKAQAKFFGWLQRVYEKFLTFCFRFAWSTLFVTIGLIVLGVFFFTRLNVQMLPKAEREMFAVEIHAREGALIEETSLVADSLARILNADPRVKCVTSFLGQSSPRFHATYSPQMASESYAQFIVNTVSSDATEELISEYSEKYEDFYPNAYIRFKQMDYQNVANPIEVYLRGEDMDEMAEYADSLKAFMASMPSLRWVHSDYDECKSVVSITMKDEEASRFGITQTSLSAFVATALEGVTLTKLYEGDRTIPVILYSDQSDTLDCQSVSEMQVPTAIPGLWVPLSQVAEVRPTWHHSAITHWNGVRTITVAADLKGNASQPAANDEIFKWVKKSGKHDFEISAGGLTKTNEEMVPQILVAIIAAIAVMFAVLLYNYQRINLSLLTISTALLTLFGAFFGLWLFGLDFSISAVLGIISLIGVIVRNSIMMFEYADELHNGPQQLEYSKAAYQAGVRRMRPIFLTSATTALGVIPMITAGTSLWMPLGVVICFGTIFTLPLIVTVLPILYWKIFDPRGKFVVNSDSTLQTTK